MGNLVCLLCLSISSVRSNLVCLLCLSISSVRSSCDASGVIPLSSPLPPSSLLLQDHLDDLLRQLIMLLSSNDVNIVTCSAGVLSNLTCNNAKNKTIVCQLHGVEVRVGIN